MRKALFAAALLLAAPAGAQEAKPGPSIEVIQLQAAMTYYRDEARKAQDQAAEGRATIAGLQAQIQDLRARVEAAAKAKP